MVISEGMNVGAQVIIAERFRGPPNSGNGGYVCGLMAGAVGGVVCAMLRAPVPLESPLNLVVDGDSVRLMTGEGGLIGEARPSTDPLPQPPPSPTWSKAVDAGPRFPGLEKPFHPICFTCGDRLDPGAGLRVFTGQVEGFEPGVVAGPWSVHEHFVDEEGLAPVEIIWAALDCPGSVAWLVAGGSAGLLGTMTCEILRRPAFGEMTMVLAWPIEASGRKRISGTALLSESGEVMARSRQIWIGRA